MVGDLVGRDEADPEATDVLALSELAAARDVHDPVEVTTEAVAVLESTRRRREISAVSEAAAVPNPEAAIRNVERDLLCLRVVGILDKLEGHDVVALEPREMATDGSEEVCCVGTARTSHGLRSTSQHRDKFR